jgi:enoyl-CoA hydratase/carnithine racemase
MMTTSLANVAVIGSGTMGAGIQTPGDALNRLAYSLRVNIKNTHRMSCGSSHFGDAGDYQRLAGRSDDYREGVSAFLAKRPPQFSGK